jgi:putative acyl-CoA dehydrogenase
MAVAIQAALLLQHAPTAVAEAFCRSRIGSVAHHNFGALPRGTDCGAIIGRAWPGAS